MSIAEKETTTGSTGFDPVRWLGLLDRASPQLIKQLALHAQLLHLEWRLEKRRLRWMMLWAALGISFVFLALLFTGFALLYLNRNNESFVLLVWALPIVFCAVATASFFLLKNLGKNDQSAFSASAQEFTADLLLLRRQL